MTGKRMGESWMVSNLASNQKSIVFAYFLVFTLTVKYTSQFDCEIFLCVCMVMVECHAVDDTCWSSVFSCFVHQFVVQH